MSYLSVKKISLYKKLFFLLAFQVLLLSGWYVYIVHDFNQDSKQQSFTAMNQIHDSLLSYTAEKLTVLDTVTSYPILKDNLSNANNSILPYLYKTRELFSLFPELYGVYLFNPEGQKITDSISDLTQQYQISQDNIPPTSEITDNRGHFQLISTGHVTSAQNSPAPDLIYGGRTLVDAKRDFSPLGVILASINIKDIDAFFERQKISSDHEYALFSNDGQMIFGNFNPDFSLSELTLPTSGTQQYNRSNDQTPYTYFITTDPDSSLYCISKIPSESLRYNSSNGFLLVLLISIVTIILIFAMIFNSISVPVRNLVKACQAFGEGDFSTRIPDTSEDELGYLTISFNNMAANTEQLINEIYVKTLAERDLELQMLRNQINPHFLYNTLESMRMTAYTQGFTDLSEMCALLAGVLRYGISDSSGTVTIAEEIRHLNAYIKLLQYRFHYSIHFNVHIEPDILSFYTIKLLLQSLVENAVNHAFSSFNGSEHIDIWGFRDKDDIIFHISDNGRGIKADKLTKLNGYINNENEEFSSIGLKNVQRRIKLYYGNKYGIRISGEEKKGTLIIMTLPINTNNNPGRR